MSSTPDPDLKMSTMEEGTFQRSRARRRTDSDEVSEEKKEERRHQRLKECIGSGFMNTDWLVAIDNTGQLLCLHSAESVQQVKRPK